MLHQKEQHSLFIGIHFHKKVIVCLLINFRSEVKKIIKSIAVLFLLGNVLLAGVYLVVSVNQETQSLEEVRVKAPGQFIKLTGGLTHYELIGPDVGKPVVFIHGGGITGMEVWKYNSMYLAEQSFQVLTYDLFGRGYSDRAPTEYTPEQLLKQFSELVDSLNIQPPFTLVSMSMGSMVALDYATLHPEKIETLILIDPAITGDYRPSNLLKIPVVSNLLMTLYWYPKAVENQRKEFSDLRVFETYSPRLAYFMDIAGYKEMNYITWMKTLNQNKVNLIAKIPANKIMLIYGSEDPYFPEGNVPHFLTLYPSLQVHEIFGAGHMPHMERPQEINEIILTHLLGQNLHTTPPQGI